MNTIVKGSKLKWGDTDYSIIEADVDITASRSAGVWLIDEGEHSNSFLMVVGARTENDAARAYARRRKALGRQPPTVFRVFALANLEPIAFTGVVDEDGEEDWSAFQNAWIEVRL